MVRDRVLNLCDGQTVSYKKFVDLFHNRAKCCTFVSLTNKDTRVWGSQVYRN